MAELRRLQRGAQGALAASLLIAAGLALLSGHAEVVPGLAAGGFVGLVNLTVLLGSARRLQGIVVSPRLLQVSAHFRLLIVGVLLGVLLIFGHVHPVGAVIGYGLFPLSAAAAGFYALRARPRLT